MKTKTKIVAFLEIAIVLCSVFLVAIPAIAAEQTAQEVSANTITTASEDDYVLGIYGNANEDDTIDMGDVVYTKLAIFGKKPKTELCDAKYDGRINVLDVIQTKLIILGKEKELTLVDSTDTIVTVKKPVKRIVVTYIGQLEMLRTLKVPADQVVGVSGRVRLHYTVFFPEYQDKTIVGRHPWSPDVEAILDLHPDVVILGTWPSESGWIPPATKAAADVLESAGIPVLHCFCGLCDRNVTEEMRKIGYIFDKRDEAEEFIDWRKGILNSIIEKVEKIPEEDNPSVYFEASRAYYTYEEYMSNIEFGGGKNIFPGFTLGANVDPEAVITRDPDIIIKQASQSVTGYDLDVNDIAEIEKVREEIMSRPELGDVKAVKTGRVHVISIFILGGYGPVGCRAFLHKVYMAKWLQPEVFEDLDPKAIHQEYLTRFQGLDIDLDKHGVFVYPEEPM